MTTRAALCVTALLLSALPALAAGAPAPATAAPPLQDPAKIALAVQILQATHSEADMGAAVNSMTPDIIANIKRGRPDLSDDTLKVFGQMFQDEVNSELPDLLKLEAQVYAEHFSLEELQYLQKFYDSGLGRKLMGETPKIMDEIGPIGIAWGQHAGQTAMNRAVEKLRAKGIEIDGAKH